MINLNNITLVNVNCIDTINAVKSLKFSSKLIKFNKVILFSSEKPNNLEEDGYFKWEKISKINSIYDYNQFMLTKLVNYINTNFCLVIQNDGFIINPHLWNDKFMNYDYIGAPWSKYAMKVWGRTNQIGNGGFSLRSKHLMNHIKSKLNLDFNIAEDVTISKIIESDKFKYPDVKTASEFSWECPVEDIPFDVTKSFGFHGTMIYDNLLNLCPNVLNIKKL
jgi:hypothetical protein